MNHQNTCLRCGACCKKGGPALHTRDLNLITKGYLSLGHLITIRKSELAHDPVTDAVKPITYELVKIRGSKGEWCCYFYDKHKNACKIYEHRPQACRTLNCWNTGPIMELAGKDLISRLEIVEKDNPLRAKVVEHEDLFPCPDLKALSAENNHSINKIIPELQKIVTGDLAYRTQVVKSFQLSVEEELFYFGRPVFQLIEPFGFMIQDTASGIKVFR